jgi:hypothetical protein
MEMNAEEYAHQRNFGDRQIITVSLVIGLVLFALEHFILNVQFVILQLLL